MYSPLIKGTTAAHLASCEYSLTKHDFDSVHPPSKSRTKQSHGTPTVCLFHVMHVKHGFVLVKKENLCVETV